MKWTYVAQLPWPPARVFPVLTELDQIVRWERDVQVLQMVSPGPLAAGSKFREIRLTGGRRYEWLHQVTRYEPDRAFCIQSMTGTVPFQGCRLLQPVEGGTRVIESGELRLGGLADFFSPVLVWLVYRAYRQSYRKVAEILAAEDAA